MLIDGKEFVIKGYLVFIIIVPMNPNERFKGWVDFTVAKEVEFEFNKILTLICIEYLERYEIRKYIRKIYKIVFKNLYLKFIKLDYFLNLNLNLLFLYNQLIFKSHKVKWKIYSRGLSMYRKTLP